MPKRKKKPQKPDRQPLFDDLNPQTKQAIGAVALLFLAIILTLSLFDLAGMVGEWIFSLLNALFGAGAYLAPLACLFYVYAFLKPKENEHVSTSKVVGIALFFISLLGYLALYKEGAGGFTGSLLEWPLNYLMGGLATTIVLTLTLLIGVFLTFNTSLSIAGLFKKREPAEVSDDIEKLELPPEEENEDEDEAADQTDPEAEAAERKKTAAKVVEKLGLGSKPAADFVVSSFEGPYDAPPLNLLSRSKGKAKTGNVKENANTIKQTLKNFGIEVEMDQVEIGPTVTRYALKPAQGVKIARIVGLQRELELNLASGTVRIEAPIPGKSLVGIEVPNLEKASIGLAALLASPEFTDSANPLMVALGKDITGKAHFANVARMPHGLIAGTTGSGKSVMIHNLIISLLYRNSPEQLRFIMVDPKRVELTLYNGIPHLMSPVITEAKKALMALKWAVKEMENRYDILQEKRVQNIASYHKNVYRPAKAKLDELRKKDPEADMEIPPAMPYIVVVMDELADLMHAYPKELEAAIVRLAQMSRAVGIHLLLATQRPSVNVITGTIKANIPTRLAMQVASQIDSRTILDQVGAEKLLGQGDMLFLSGELSKPIRLQSAFVSEDELKRVIDFLKTQTVHEELSSLPDFDAQNDGPGDDSIFGTTVDDEEGDELYNDALKVILESGKASTSFLQRRMRIGYSRAARLIDLMEEKGIIGPQDGAKPRAILINATDTLAEDDDGSDADDTDTPDDAHPNPTQF